MKILLGMDGSRYALAATRFFPPEPMLTNALVLPFLIRVTFCMRASSFANRRAPALSTASHTSVQLLSKAA